MRSTPSAHARPKRWSAPTCSSACRRPARSSPRWSRTWPPSRSSSRWPIPIRKSSRRTRRPRAPTRSSPPAAPISQPGQQRARLPVHLPRRARRSATAINDEMKIAAAEALAELARERCPRKSPRPMAGNRRVRPRLYHPGPVRPAADGGRPSAVAKRRWKRGGAAPIENFDEYRHELRARLNPTVRAQPRLRGGEGEPQARAVRRGRGTQRARAAIAFRERGSAPRCSSGARTSDDLLSEMGVEDPASYEVLNSRNSPLVGRAGRSYLREAPAPRPASPRGRADGQPGPQLLRCGDALAGRSRRDDHRHHPPVQPVASAGAARHRG
jgi:hypothetical protein